MKRKLLTIVLCGFMALGITGCGNNNQEDKSDNQKDNRQEEKKTEETKKLKVGDFEINYGYYKSDEVTVVKIMENNDCLHGGTSYKYRIEGNYIIFYEPNATYYDGETAIKKDIDKLKLRVIDNKTLVNELDGQDIDTLKYYES